MTKTVIKIFTKAILFTVTAAASVNGHRLAAIFMRVMLLTAKRTAKENILTQKAANGLTGNGLTYPVLVNMLTGNGLTNPLFTKVISLTVSSTEKGN